MARSWQAVRDAAVARGQVDEQRVGRVRKEMVGELRTHRLAEIRESHHVTQRSLAATMEVSQARISTIERGELAWTELGTLQAYVEALGSRLKVVADFGDESLVVRD